MSDAIKPCPFCGSSDVRLDYSHKNFRSVTCDNCDCIGPEVDANEECLDWSKIETPDDVSKIIDPIAVDRWNMRADK